MNIKEKNTDLWVYDLLKEAEIKLDPQGSSIKEINEALKSASKRGTGSVGFPEYTGVVKDFLIVIENKASVSNHENRTKDDLLAEDSVSICNFAVNGALFYGKHLAKNTSYKKIIAIGVSGNYKKHRITPLFINERGDYEELPEIETFISFSKDNIDEYYVREVLKENTNFEKETQEILKDAATLHEDLRNYGSIQDKDKPLIVSGILLALREIEQGNFSIDLLTGDTRITDGQKIYNAIKANLQRANVSPEVKRDKLLNQFSVIKDTTKINQINPNLGKTPNRHYTEFLYENIYKSIRYNKSGEDYLGRFYGEFMSYSGGDGQTLGIILTPRHITELFCNLLSLKPEDKVIDPCCGTGGFLIAAMHDMLQKADDNFQKENIRKNQLFGIEDQSYMFTIATTNMILRGDGKSNLENQDFLKQNPAKLQLKGCTIGMMNPPYSQGSSTNPSLYEISFTEHLLKSIVKGGKVAVIVPQSTMTGKTKHEKETKANILKYHTLEGVITLNKNTFYSVGVNPCIAVFTVGIPHHKNKMCKFINFEDDGHVVAKHIGLIETSGAKDKKQHLLDVWFNRIEAETKFCVKTTIEADDEWLHSFYYFNDEIPSDEDFRNTIADYISFEVNMITHGKGYLFGLPEEYKHVDEIVKLRMVADGEENKMKKRLTLNDVEWKEFKINDLFFIKDGYYNKKPPRTYVNETIPFLGATAFNNGVTEFYNEENIDKWDKVGNISSNGLSKRYFEGNCLAIVNNGSVGYVYYQPHKFTCSHDITPVYLKNYKLNQKIGMFLALCLEKTGETFTYARKWRPKRIRKSKVFLPVDCKNSPNYQFMENYIKQEQKEITQKIIDYYK